MEASRDELARFFGVVLPHLNERQRLWAAFQGDPAWQKVRQESERDGVLTARISVQIWKPTDYSPLG